MRSFGLVALGLLLGALSAARASAAEPRVAFRIPAGARAEALIQFALQADLSLADPAACGGRSPALSGMFTKREALQRLLARSGCDFEFLDPRMVRIRRAPPRPSLPRVSPSAHEAQAGRVPELIVTATRAETSIDKVAGAVSLVGQDQIKVMGATDAQDLAPVVVGLATTNLGPGRDKIMLRGLSDGVFTGRTQSSVGIFLDDVPLTRNAPNPDLRLSDIRRVEVARGPEGALYGAGTLAGVYRMVPNPPELETVSAEVSAVLSATQDGGPSHSVDMMLNLPLIRDRVALRLVGYGELRGGYIHAAQRGSPVVDQTLRNGGRASLRFQINPDWRLDVSSALQTLSTADTHYIVATPRREFHPHRLAEAHHNTLREGAIVVSGSGDWGSFTSTTGFVSHAFSSGYDASPIALDSPPPRFEALFVDSTRTRLFTQDMILRSPDRDRVRWLAGAYFADIGERTISSLQLHLGDVDPRRLFDKDRKDHTVEAALFGRVSYDFGADWTVSAGLRTFESSVDHRSRLQGSRETGVQTLGLPFGGVSPTLSLQRVLRPSVTVYALYSEGYRLGGANAIGFDRGRHKPLTFSPDRLQNYELGLNFRALDGRLWGRAAGFYEYWRDVQSDQYTWAGSPFTANVGDLRDLGAGLEGGCRWREHFSAQLQVQTTSARLVRWDRRYVMRPSRGLPGVPAVSGGGLVEYRRPLSGGLSLRLVGQASYIGRSRVTFESDSQTMGGYVADRLSAYVTGAHWSAGLFVNNIANESRDTFAFGNPFSFGRTRQTTPQRPRTVGVRASASL